MKKITCNILRVWDQASDCDKSEGMLAYERYHKTLEGISQNTKIPLVKVAGVFAALSPNNDYAKNLSSCLTVCLGFSEGRKESECVVTTYNHNRTKAWRILNGEHFYSVFKGLKVRNFWRNLTEPNHPEAITIDGHMVNISRGVVQGMSEASITKGQYKNLARIYRSIAADLGLLPCQLQAILWFAWKRINNIVYNGAGESPLLFPYDNEWGVFVPFMSIIPYPFRDNSIPTEKENIPLVCGEFPVFKEAK